MEIACGQGNASEPTLAPRRGLISFLAWVSLAAALTASAARPTFREDPDYLIDTWDTEDGWPGSSAFAMAQTSDGYLWLGTREGLVRFDGVRFRLFDQSNLPQLPHPTILKLLLDRQDRLWLGTVRGLAFSSGTDWRTVAFPGTNNNRGDYVVHSLAERANGDLLVTTLDGGVLEFSAGRLHPLPSPPGATNTSYVGGADDAGSWWVVQHQFVGKWDGQRWVPTVSLADTANLAPGRVACAPARTGGLWLLLGSELRRYRSDAEVQRTSLPGFKATVSDFREDSRGNIWISTTGAGLWQVSSNRQVRHWSPSNGLPDQTVFSAFEDREKNIWVGTARGGLTRFKQRRLQSFLTVTNPWVFARFALASPPTGGVLIASWQRGLWRSEPGGLTKVPLPKPCNDSFVSGLSLLVDRSGRTWIGALTNGVWRVEGQNARWLPIDQSGQSPVARLFEDSHSRIWLAGGQSASVFEAGEMRGIGPAQGLPAGSVHSFAEDKTGTIWLAHERGLFRLESNRCVEVLDGKGGSLVMSSLCLDADRTLWMASINTGLYCWRDGRLLQKSLPLELPVRGAYTLLDDHRGSFWMTSPRGLLCAEKRDLLSWLEGKLPSVNCRVFDLSDGLPGVDCTGSAMDPQGPLWFATSRGVARVDPAADVRNPTPPPVMLEELTYHSASTRVYGGDEAAPEPPVRARLKAPFPAVLMLPPGSRRLQVQYTALDFSAPDKLRFQTRLEPLDNDWQDVGDRRVAYYYDFNPGSYVFRVRAVNHDGTWNETGANLPFTVQPFAWQTWWFRGTVVAALLSLGVFATWLVSRYKHQRALEELQRSRRHQGELAHLARVAMLGELTASLAHEINQPLGAILRNAEAAELFLNQPSPDLDELRAILTDIRKDDQRAGAVIDRLRSLLQRREVEHGLLDLNPLLRETVAVVRPDAALRQIRFALELEPSLPPVHGDPVQLQQVLLNLLLNAMDALNDKPRGNGRVSVRTRRVDASVEVSVHDNGHGIPADKLTNVFEPFFTSKASGLGMGLAISRRIIEAHGGRIRAENNLDGGATFAFTLPREGTRSEALSSNQ